ncbi:MAG: proline racemase family protein [Phycisphaerales bacterium]
MIRLRAIDSHTEGEPTRVVVDGFPDLAAAAGTTDVDAQRRLLRERFDHLRRAVVNEPRGADHWVGAILVPPSTPRAISGVVFFNNVGVLNACGHGTIGVAATLAHLGRLGPGRHVLETSVGEVPFVVGAGAEVTIENVPARRTAADVAIHVAGAGRVVGDVAWGGNWFFLVREHGLDLALGNIEALTAYTCAVRDALRRAGVRGEAPDGTGAGSTDGEIDHIELFGPPVRGDCDSRNFVLCPGKAYDRSPCGTGTSAKMACLLADGRLAEGAPWRQESIVGSRFVGTIRREGDVLRPTITGAAYITAETTLVIDERDPFAHGFPAR